MARHLLGRYDLDTIAIPAGDMLLKKIKRKRDQDGCETGANNEQVPLPVDIRTAGKLLL
jgi:hypothetical protein